MSKRKNHSMLLRGIVSKGLPETNNATSTVLKLFSSNVSMVLMAFSQCVMSNCAPSSVLLNGMTKHSSQVLSFRMTLKSKACAMMCSAISYALRLLGCGL